MQWNTQPECWNRRFFEIKYKKCYQCQITFHTVEYSTSREDKGRTIVLKIQGHWGEIAFRVLVQSSMRAVGCWANRTCVWKLHGWSLSLFLSLMLQKDEHLFSADHSTLLSRSGHVPALAKVRWGNASTFMKISLTKWDSWLHFLSCCHPPVYSCYGAPSGTGSRRCSPVLVNLLQLPKSVCTKSFCDNLQTLDALLAHRVALRCKLSCMLNMHAYVQVNRKWVCCVISEVTAEAIDRH